MENNIKLTLPEFITNAFPVLKDSEYIRSFATLFVLYPDTQFYLFQSAGRDSLRSFILVATDYSDPLDQSYELKEITGRYEFEFTRIVAPYRNDKFIEIRQHDDIEAGYDIRDPHRRWNYYLAEATYKPDWTE
jgi:hypothetical protein cdivTM_09436